MKQSINIQSLASYAVMQTLYSDNKNLYSVIGGFVDQLMIKRQILSSFAPDQLGEWMQEEYGMSIPIAILLKVCKEEKYTKLVRAESKTTITVNSALISSIKEDNIQKQIDEELKNDIELLNLLIEYIQEQQERDLTEEERNKVERAFCAYFTDTTYVNEYESFVCDFILNIQNNGSKEQKEQLKSIKEGLFLRLGLTYQSDYSNFNVDELHIYLDTEIIFDALGYNGTLWKQLFDDFRDQIRLVNSHKKKACIQLHYFDRTNEDIENFFTSARSILEGRSVVVTKTAMRNIIEQAVASTAGLDNVYALYQEGLRDLSISKVPNPISAENNESYLLPYHELQDKFAEADKDKFEDSYQFLNYIQYLRKSSRCTDFSQIRHVFLTGTYLTRRMASQVAFNADGPKSVPLALDLEFITAKLWFANNSNLKGDNTLHQLDAACKARVILSSNNNASIVELVEKLKAEAEENQWTDEHVHIMFASISEKMKNPEEINDSEDAKPNIPYTSIQEYKKYIEDKERKYQDDIKAREDQISEAIGMLRDTNKERDKYADRLYEEYKGRVESRYHIDLSDYKEKRRKKLRRRTIWVYVRNIAMYLTYFILLGIILYEIDLYKEHLKDAGLFINSQWLRILVSAIILIIPYAVTVKLKQSIKELFEIRYKIIQKRLEEEYEQKYPIPHLEIMSKEDYLRTIN